MSVDAVSINHTVLESEKIGNSSFDTAWLISALDGNDSLFKAIHEKNKVQNVKAKTIGAGKGFVSNIYKCTIEFESDHADYEVILKIPGVHALEGAVGGSEKDSSFVESVAKVHNLECFFYTDYAAKSGLPTPKIYSAGKCAEGKEGYLLMENMIGKGESSCVFEGFSKAQLYTIVRHLVKLHFAFLTMEDQSWQSQFDPKNGFSEQESVDFCIPMYEKVMKMKPDGLGRKIKPLYEACKSGKFFNYILFEHRKDYGLPPVLSHGDLWCNNIMWKLDSDGYITNEVAAIIDFQIVHTGSLTNDLARVIVCCSDAEVRRQYEADLLKFYYDSLSSLFASAGKEVPFSFDQMNQAFKISYLSAVVDILWMIPLFCDGEKELGTEALWEARTEKLVLRASLALDEALKTLENIPKERIAD
ncbi:hypothetical protein QR680_013833 [Steinernema hermaphroditum]|uniref:CHK kinase-like domain-containing protein n=1 Tax=Steinernema hermaphroditum TaxID=289476 RepID=A0AA39M271_9BILA|nr:hypothetical protein QR680_013833 [Steinernema hermaphroditum]